MWVSRFWRFFLFHEMWVSRLFRGFSFADKALETLAQAVAAGWRGNWRLLLELRSLDSIRDDPRFIAQKLILERDMEAQLESYLSSQGIVYR
jgi:hypothetical protein